MKPSALIITAMLGTSFVLPAQAPDPMGTPVALNLTHSGPEGWTPGLFQAPRRHERDRAPSRRHSRRSHRRLPEPQHIPDR